MKFTINIKDKTYEVDVSPETHESVPSKVKLNGKLRSVFIRDEWSKEFPRHLIIGNDSYEAEFEYGEDGFPKRIWLNGVQSDIKIDFLGKSKLSKVKGPAFLSEGFANIITAPMPGRIVRICIRESQLVESGELCVILEAMKMENELQAKMSGLVRKLHVKEGDLVDIDQILVTFDDKDEMFY